MTAYEVLLAWAKSPGFAAIHNGAATDEQIVDDLLKWLGRHDMVIVDEGTAGNAAWAETVSRMVGLE